MEPSAPSPSEQPVDLTAAFGAETGVAVQCFAIYIPDKDRNDQDIGNQRRWVLDAIALLCDNNGGATAIPVEGGWLSPEGRTILEHPVIVYSYVTQPDRFVRVTSSPPVPAPPGPRDRSGRSGL
jgi:hypothetical protein